LSFEKSCFLAVNTSKVKKEDVKRSPKNKKMREVNPKKRNMLSARQIKASLESQTRAFPLQLKSCRLHFADGKVNTNF
jgi:hypothetical protein